MDGVGNKKMKKKIVVDDVIKYSGNRIMFFFSLSIFLCVLIEKEHNNVILIIFVLAK